MPPNPVLQTPPETHELDRHAPQGIETAGVKQNNFSLVIEGTFGIARHLYGPSLPPPQTA